MPTNKWDDKFFTDIYEYARNGLSDAQIGERLGYTQQYFITYLAKRPAVKYALERARNPLHKDGTSSTGAFFDFVYDRLPDHLREVWQQINAVADADTPRERLREILAPYPTRARQHLFLHALVANNFSKSAACRMIGLTRQALKVWINEDAEFAELVDEVLQECRKDFFESAAMRSVREGDPTIIRHVLRTVCKDRGYGDPPKQLNIDKKSEHTERRTTDIQELLSYLSADEAETMKGLITRAYLAKESGAPKRLDVRQPALTHQS